MRLVLDTNEYLYAFGLERKVECEDINFWLGANAADVELFVPRMVVDEITRNLANPILRRIHRFWKLMECSIDDDGLIPADLYESYIHCGLKSADARIGAYAEWVDADYLISENRDFLSLAGPLPFRVTKAAAFLKEYS